MGVLRLCAISAFLVWTLAGAKSLQASPTTNPDKPFKIAQLLYSDDFPSDSGQWTTELENGGTVAAKDGRMDIDVTAGATIWFKHLLQSPVLVQYEATVISASGPNDRVSDLNCFWMARDTRNPSDIFAVHRTGKFADYNQLLTYYVGLGGNGNTTTRFRRYIGDPIQRPLLPQYDLRDKADMLQPNKPQLIQLIASAATIQYYRDGKLLFDFTDPHPYTSGWFAIRTTKNHMQIRRLRIFSIVDDNGTKKSDSP
jgi:hypothetical protein